MNADLHDLYEAILARRSVRRYENGPLDLPTLDRVLALARSVRPLVAGNRFSVGLRQATGSESLVDLLGAYGNILTPPHFLVPYVEGDKAVLVDLGYRVEQIAVGLAGMGIGSCFVGALGREEEAKVRFGVPESARIGALLVFGRPATALFGRAVNAAMRKATGATNKHAVERIFYRQTFDSTSQPPSHLVPLLEAARHAPSAVDAQPWRFLWRDERLHLFVKRKNARYGGLQDYRLYDGGICMANVSLALTAMGMIGEWQLSAENGEVAPHPEDLEPLAVLELAGEVGTS